MARVRRPLAGAMPVFIILSPQHHGLVQMSYWLLSSDGERDKVSQSSLRAGAAFNPDDKGRASGLIQVTWEHGKAWLFARGCFLRHKMGFSVIDASRSTGLRESKTVSP